MSDMRLMMAYFSHFDGKQKWEVIAPVVEETFHANLVVVDGKEKFERQAFVERLQHFVEAGGSMEVLKLKQHPTGIRYEVIYHNPADDKKQRNKVTKSLGTFQDGKLVRVQRDNTRRAVAVL